MVLRKAKYLIFAVCRTSDFLADVSNLALTLINILCAENSFVFFSKNLLL